MKKLIWVVVALVVAVGGYYYNESRKPPEVPEFMKMPVSQGDVVEVVNATGILQADRMVKVGSKVSGVIDELYVDFNSIVKQGQVLARVNTELLQTQVRIQEANIARQRVELESQRVQLEDLEQNLKRTRELREKQLVTQQALEAAELQVKSRVAQINSAEQGMISSQINLDQAKINVTEATIISPIDGVVVNRIVDKGQTIVGSQSATPFFDIATELTTLKLEGGVDESEIGKVRTGMIVRFTVDAYPNRNFEGRITMVRINPTTQSNVVTYTTVASVQNNDLALKTGMTASMRIEVARRDNVMRVPAAALRFRPTNDMWAALKQEPPTPARGGGPGRNGGGAPGAAATTTAAPGTPATPPAATQQAAATPAANPFGREGGAREGGGREGGRTGGMNMTPEQREAAMARFGGRGGRGGGQGRGGNGQTAPPPVRPQGATSIDQLFPELVRIPTRAQVYVLRPADATHPYGTLERLDIMQGISDGTFTELVSGPPELTVGAELVTNIMMPWLTTTTLGGATQGNPFSGQQQGGRGGMPGGGNPGGGGGGGGRGGGR
jgi:HlyD family secretion protein